ncbi:YcnI family protein [Rhodococcus sp. HNM0569]|uniref:YcnI family copper-binding membrane protein n=1 Tax=Rhodococcus sp. HNM0569 TaxID=2716340 RepID=UPI00146B4E98|nr:YcnI family protein [Rhodococcus sp. HNM0569]NLU85076.1 YcnI family protein [Rhodococcus sp. HNM0569]
MSRFALTAGATAGALVLSAGIASAHVSVVAPDAEQGGYTVLTFRVPTESDTASTTKLTVELPNLKSARTEPLPGWTSVVDKDPTSKEATSVTWTADPGVGVAPGQFQQFVLSAGPLPESDEVSFPAQQTYDDGQVVAWDQPVGDDGSEPEHPAPSLSLAASSGDGHGHGASASDSAAAADETASSKDDTARWLGGIGLVLGALGAALGLGAVIRGRRS